MHIKREFILNADYIFTFTFPSHAKPRNPDTFLCEKQHKFPPSGHKHM